MDLVREMADTMAQYVQQGNKFVSPEGYTVEFLGVLKVRFWTRRAYVDVMIEPLMGDQMFVVWKHSMSHWNIFGGTEPMTDADREFVAREIADAMTTQGNQIEIAE